MVGKKNLNFRACITFIQIKKLMKWCVTPSLCLSSLNVYRRLREKDPILRSIVRFLAEFKKSPNNIYAKLGKFLD